MKYTNKLPYIFSGISKEMLTKTGLKLVPQSRALLHLDLKTLQTFGNVYFDVLNAMVEEDHEYLSAVMEPNLYDCYQSGLEETKKNEQKLYTNDVLNEFDDLSDEQKRPPLVSILDF